VKISSDVLARVLQATGKQAGIEALQAQDLQVIPAFYPMLRAMGPIQRFGGFAPGARQTDTFMRRDAVAQNGVNPGTDKLLATFSRGLWRITGQLRSMCDFTPAGITSAGFVNFVDDLGNITSWLETIEFLNLPQQANAQWEVCFPTDDWTLHFVTGQSGAGQNVFVSTSIYAERLL